MSTRKITSFFERQGSDLPLSESVSNNAVADSAVIEEEVPANSGSSHPAVSAVRLLYYLFKSLIKFEVV